LELILFLLGIPMMFLVCQLVIDINKKQTIKKKPCYTCRHSGVKFGDSHCLIRDHPIFWLVETEPCHFFSPKGKVNEKRQDPEGPKARTKAQKIHRFLIGKNKGDPQRHW